MASIAWSCYLARSPCSSTLLILFVLLTSLSGTLPFPSSFLRPAVAGVGHIHELPDINWIRRRSYWLRY